MGLRVCSNGPAPLTIMHTYCKDDNKKQPRTAQNDYLFVSCNDRIEQCCINLHICSGYFTQVSEPWPLGLLFKDYPIYPQFSPLFRHDAFSKITHYFPTFCHVAIFKGLPYLSAIFLLFQPCDLFQGLPYLTTRINSPHFPHCFSHEAFSSITLFTQKYRTVPAMRPFSIITLFIHIFPSFSHSLPYLPIVFSLSAMAYLIYPQFSHCFSHEAFSLNIFYFINS